MDLEMHLNKNYEGGTNEKIDIKQVIRTELSELLSETLTL